MAQPNIVGVTTIRGNTAVMNVTNVSTNVIANIASSGKVLKLNTILISNIDGTNAADINVSFFREAVEYRLASTISVPPDATLVVVSKDTAIYLEEGDYVRLTASANNRLNGIVSYEEIS